MNLLKISKIITYYFILLICFITLSPLHASDKTRVAVVNLVAKSGISEATAATVTDLLTGELVGLKKFDVVDRANLNKVLKEQALQQSGCTEQACAVKLGNILNVQKLIVGSISKLGDNIVISVNFVDVEKSRIDLSEKISATNENDLLPKVQQLAQKIDSSIPLVGRLLTKKSDATYLANLGSVDGVALGTSVKITRMGQAIIDQATGDLLGRDVLDLGFGIIKELNPSGSLSLIQLSASTNIIKEGDRVEVITNLAKNNFVAKIPELAKPSGDVPVIKPILLISGITLAAGGGGLALYSYLSITPALAAYRALPAATSQADFDNKYQNYLTFRDLTLVGSIIGGTGVALIVTSLFIPNNKKPNKTAIYPTFDGKNYALNFFSTF